jgi:hypothetical protein
MTEEEWRLCSEPDPMLAVVRSKGTDRKFRLFAAACCRDHWHLLTDERSRTAVDMAERFANDEITAGELERAATAAAEAVRPTQNAFGLVPAAAETATQRVHFAPDTPFDGPGPLQWYYFTPYWEVVSTSIWWLEGMEPEPIKVQHAAHLRDIFGNPFRPLTFNPAWRTDTAVTLARTMYESREFSAMPILADALQDAGCDSDDILTHCRDTNQVHVRGCWVVDLVLGKE